MNRYKPGKAKKKPLSLERVLKIILALGLLFVFIEAVSYLLTGSREKTANLDATKIVASLISTVNYPVQELPTRESISSPTRMVFTETPQATPIPDVPYILPAKNYIPDVPGILGNYALDSEQIMDISPMRGNASQAVFTNSYPIYHDSDDAYYVSYTLYVFSDFVTTDDFYNSFTMDSLISIYQNSYNQRIYPQPIDRMVEDIDAIKMFCFNFTGTTNPELHCQASLKDENLVGQVTIKLFDLGSSATKAISQINYFMDLLVNTLK